MTDGIKGAWLGAATIVTIALLWSAAAGTGFDTTCTHFEPWPASEIVRAGVMLGLPCGLFAGAALGRLAGVLHELRRVILLGFAVVLTCVLTGLARIAMQCSLDPATSTLWLRAFAPLAIASLVLERWTRPNDPLPRATAL